MAEIFRLFKLGLDQAYSDDYAQIGKDNFIQSIEKEAGTLATYASHVYGDTSKQIVVERYASEEVYQEHIASQHFQAFAELAKKAVTSREVINLVPEIFLQKPQEMRVFEKNDLSVRLATVRVNDNAAFSDIVLPEMRASMEKEPGVLIMYAGRSVDQPDTWYFFEVYQDEAVYEHHRDTAHFKDYIEKSEQFLINKDLQTLTADLLVNRG
ncbi:putative quinol monooxygenase [Streptococcus merionis]|uniref:putative quinol monooxygenase n=1 Tax=Streptococcus merionis TaxID=400065 RepID=UPI0026E9B0A0|nr:antibiotic biosynthesis monooxygenase [Streptococcus merionis]